MENKQSSIEWLGLELNIIFHDLTPELWEQVEVKFQQAKQMHKEEVVDAYREGRTDQQSSSDSFYNRNAESYFNEAFGGETD